MINVTFSPDGKLLLFVSARSSVDSGAHSATDSLHKIDWPVDGVPCSSAKVVDVVSSSSDFYLFDMSLLNFCTVFNYSLLRNSWLNSLSMYITKEK